MPCPTQVALAAAVRANPFVPELAQSFAEIANFTLVKVSTQAV